MNVLFLDNERGWRGGQEQIFTLMRGLHQRGIYSMLVGPEGTLLARRVCEIGVRHTTLSWRGELGLAWAPGLLRVLAERRWDIVHFNTPSGIIGAAFWSRRARVPLRVLSRRVNFPLRGWASRWKYMYATDYIITVSSGIAATLRDCGIPADRIGVVYEGIDVAEIESTPAERLYPEGICVIGCVAFLSREKGHSTLLAAFARLQARRPAVRLVLLGDGPLQADLERQAKQLGVAEAVLFLGFREQVAPLLRGFDIFVLPSLSEGLSSGILAAMAAGLPVVASNIGGIPELVRDGVTGTLVPAGEPRALAEALEHLVDRPDVGAACGVAGREVVLKNFTLDQKVERTLAIYEALLSR